MSMQVESRRMSVAECTQRRDRLRELCSGSNTSLIKCCGMFRDCDIDAINDALPDFCGFICEFPKSHRSLPASEASRLARNLDNRILSVAVTVNLDVCEIAKIAGPAESLPAFDIIQLHGSEDDACIAQIRQLTDAPIIQAFRVRSEEDVRAACESTADMILLDSGQGSGETFDWSLLKVATRPFMLAGGLGPENVTQAISQVNPWAVDMSSSLETNKVKDPQKITDAVNAVRRSAC